MEHLADELRERCVTPRGQLALRRRGAQLELISNGVFLMDTSDGRAERLLADMLPWLATDTGTFDAICLDIDNGPSWTVNRANARLCGEAGLDRLAACLSSAGALGVWSAAPDDLLERALFTRFAAVRCHQVPVLRGPPDVVTVAADRR